MQIDPKRNTAPMQEVRQRISEVKYQTLKVVLEDMIYNQEKITIPRIIELSKLSKSYLYKNERAKQLIEVPYIYTEDEVIKLMAECQTLYSPDGIRARTTAVEIFSSFAFLRTRFTVFLETLQLSAMLC